METFELQGKILQFLFFFLKLSICGFKVRVFSVFEFFLVQEREEDCLEVLEKAFVRNVFGCQISVVVSRIQFCWLVCWVGLVLGRFERCWLYLDFLLKLYLRYFSQNCCIFCIGWCFFGIVVFWRCRWIRRSFIG